MSNDELRDELQARIPEPDAAHWSSIDQRLAEIEAADDFEGEVATLDVITPLERDHAGTVRRPAYALIAAAALVAIVGIGVLVLGNRPGAANSQTLAVATQPDSETQDGSPKDGSEAIDGPPQPAKGAPLVTEGKPGATVDATLQTQPSDTTPECPEGFTPTADGANCSQAALVVDADFQDPAGCPVGAVTPDGGSCYVELPPPLHECNVGAPLIAGSGEDTRVLCLFGPVGNTLAPGSYCAAGVLSADQLSCIVSPLDARAESDDGGTPLEAMRARANAGGRDLGSAGPFCFAADRSYSFLRLDYEDVFESSVVASLSIDPSGMAEILLRTASEVSASFAGAAPATPDGRLGVDFAIVSAEGATWGDTIRHDVSVTDATLVVRDSPLALVDCATIEDELSIVREAAARMMAWRFPEPSLWRFIDSPVNHRVTPGADGEIAGVWVGAQTVLDAGRRAIVDDVVWIALAATDDLPSGWVEQSKLIPAPGDSGHRCFSNGTTSIWIENVSATGSFQAVMRRVIDGNNGRSVEHSAIAGRAPSNSAGAELMLGLWPADAVLDVRILPVGVDDAISQEWSIDLRGLIIENEVVGPRICPDPDGELIQTTNAISEYPQVPD